MLRLIIYSICTVVFVAAITWRDCVPDVNKRLVELSEFRVTPEKVMFPGDFNVWMNLTFLSQLEYPFVDFELTRYLFGFPLKLPCRDDTVVGTCNSIDICWLLNRSIHDTDPAHINSYGHKLERLMNKTTGHWFQCPIKAESIILKNQPFSLLNLSSIIHLLADGDYMIKVQARENKTGPIIGCVEVRATVTGEAGANIFG